MNATTTTSDVANLPTTPAHVAATLAAAHARKAQHALALRVDRKELHAATVTLNKVRPTRSPKAILTGVLLAADATGAAYVEATDLDTTLRVYLPSAIVERPGAVVIDGKTLGEIARSKAMGDAIDFAWTVFVNKADDSRDWQFKAYGARSHVRLANHNADDFPRNIDAANGDWHGCVDIHASELRRALEQTVTATDNESSRYALGGVLIEAGEINSHHAAAKPGTVRLIGTDGRRLHLATPLAEHVEDGKTFDTPSGATGGCIIPARACKAIAKALAKRDDVVTVARLFDAVKISTPGVVVVARLLEGRFPRWRDVFPQRSDSLRITCGAEALANAWKQAAACTSDESRGVNCTLNLGSQTAELVGESEEKGESVADHPFAIERGGDVGEVAITLDPAFMADAWKACGKESATLDLVNADAACVVSCEATRFAAVVMPLARARR